MDMTISNRPQVFISSHTGAPGILMIEIKIQIPRSKTIRVADIFQLIKLIGSTLSGILHLIQASICLSIIKIVKGRPIHIILDY